jgi:hypothetical protein
VDIGQPNSDFAPSTSHGNRDGVVFTAKVVNEDPVVKEIRERTITTADRYQRLARTMFAAVSAPPDDWNLDLAIAAIDGDNVDDLIPLIINADHYFGRLPEMLGRRMLTRAINHQTWKVLVFLIFDCALNIAPLYKIAYRYIQRHLGRDQAEDMKRFFDEECGGLRLVEQGHELVAASFAGDAVSVRRLLDTGVFVNHTTGGRHGRTALMVASQEGHADVVALLLSHEGVYVDQWLSTDGRTALMLASGKKHVNVMVLLLGGGANKNLRDKQGRTSQDWMQRDGTTTNRYDVFEKR